MTIILKRNEFDPDVWDIAVRYGSDANPRYGVWTNIHDDMLHDNGKDHAVGTELEHREDHNSIECIIITKARYDELIEKEEDSG